MQWLRENVLLAPNFSANSNLYMSFNTRSMMENKAINLDMNFGARFLGIVKWFTFNNTFGPPYIPQAYFGIDLFFIVFLGSLQQQFGFLQDFFMVIGQVLTI